VNDAERETYIRDMQHGDASGADAAFLLTLLDAARAESASLGKDLAHTTDCASEEIAKLRAEGEARAAFYDVTVKQRDAAWQEVETLRSDVAAERTSHEAQSVVARESHAVGISEGMPPEWRVRRMREALNSVRADLARAKAILVDAVNAIGNGSGAAHGVSLDFLADLPGEIEGETKKLRQERDAFRDDRHAIAHALGCSDTGPGQIVRFIERSNSAMHSPETIERIAEAIYRNEGGITDEDYPFEVGGQRKLWKTDAPWDSNDGELREHERDDYRAQARAAVSVLLGLDLVSEEPVT